MARRINIPLGPVTGKVRSTGAGLTRRGQTLRRVLLCGALLVALATSACTSVSQMQQRYEAGDTSQLDKISTIAARQDYPYATRRAAARALGEIGESQAVPVLVGILGEFDQRTTLKSEALLALGRIGDPKAVSGIGRLLDRSLNDTNDELRIAAMPVLGKLGGTEAATILVNALTYYDILMLQSQHRVPRGVFTGDEQSIRDLQDSLRGPTDRAGDLTGLGGGGTSGMFGGTMALPDERRIDTTPQERALAHTSLVRVGEAAIPVIHEHLSLRETTVSLRNELHKILGEIRGDAPSEDSTENPG